MIRSRRRRAAARSLVLLRLVKACTSCGRLEMISVWLLVLKLLVGTHDVFFPPCCILPIRLHTGIVHHPLFKNAVRYQKISNVYKSMVSSLALYDCLSFMIVPPPAAELHPVLQI